jgi:hypothetical protein
VFLCRDCPVCSSGCDATTISEGYNKAFGDPLLQVKTGSYSEDQLIIGQSMTLEYSYTLLSS